MNKFFTIFYIFKQYLQHVSMFIVEEHDVTYLLLISAKKREKIIIKNIKK